MDEDDARKRQLGKILLRQKLVTPDELDMLLTEQQAQPGRRLASVAVDSGKVARGDLLQALSEQHGLPAVDLTQAVIPLSNLKLIPEEIARQHHILPVQVTDDRIFLAMADPNDRRIVDEIEFVTGRRVFPYVSLHDDLGHVIASVYQMAESGKSYYVGHAAPEETVRGLGVPSELIGGNPSLAPKRVDPRSEGHLASLPPTKKMPALLKPSSPAPPNSPLFTLSKPAPPAVVDSLMPPPVNKQLGALSKPPFQAKTTRVLIVDDEPDIRRLLRRVLEERGFYVLEAAKGLEALELVRDGSPDLILLDAMLPEVHGFEICRRIKGSKRYGHIPIIMISAIYRGWRVAADLTQSYGAFAFIEKPFRIGEVMAKVDEALSGRDPKKDAEQPEDQLSAQADVCFQRGMEAYQAGEYDEAATALQDGVNIDPLSFKLHYHLGLLYGRQENVFQAIHELETAADLAPRHFAALKNLAVLYQKAGFKHKSVEMWERALGTAPDDDTRRGIKEHLMTLL